MQLNVTTDYAVRAMVYLASEKRMVSGVEIAEKMQIPSAYLLTIMAKLKKAGFVTSKRGNVGGYLLAKPQNEISLWDIMVVMEGSMQVNRCMEEEDTFTHRDEDGFRELRDVYRAVQESVETRLRSETLDKLASNFATAV
jgi:Rrf2 family nitric oxide-sensitive transcriptional repressor